jgi:hypothetical protein
VTRRFSGEETAMADVQSVQTCRWGSPTLFLPWPLWYDATRFEWSCTRGARPRGIDEASHCRVCPNWTPAASAGRHDDDHLGSVAP